MSKPYPVSDALRSRMWSVDAYAVKIMRQDDKVKLRRLIREYRKATDALLSVAMADREARMAARPTPSAAEGRET